MIQCVFLHTQTVLHVPHFLVTSEEKIVPVATIHARTSSGYQAVFSSPMAWERGLVSTT